jgi:hypothetical protein
MSIATTYNGVARFVQSLECKLKGCSNEDVSYNFSGYESDGNYHIQGVPIRSCGCKAEKSFNRLQPTLSQMRDLFGKCYNWNGVFVAYTDRNWREYNKHNIALHYGKYHLDCWERAERRMRTQERLYYQASFAGHDEEANLLIEKKHENCQRMFCDCNLLPHIHFPNREELFNSLKAKVLAKAKGRLNFYTERRQQPVVMFDVCRQWYDTKCTGCNKDMLNQGWRYDCNMCKFDQELNEAHLYADEELPQEEDEGVDELDVTIDADVIRPSSPVPENFEVFIDAENNFINVPHNVVQEFAIPIDDEHDFYADSDDEQRDFNEYMFNQGYF